MPNSALSFSELERRILAIPDGPSSVLNTPRWIIRCNVIGTIAIVMGLLPSVLIKVMAPQMWMVYVVRSGLGIALIAYAPGSRYMGGGSFHVEMEVRTARAT